jgi:hypothetical protein
MSSHSHLRRIDSFKLLHQDEQSPQKVELKVNVKRRLQRPDPYTILDAQTRLEKLTWKLSPFNGKAFCQVILAVLTEQKSSKYGSSTQFTSKNSRKCAYERLATIRRELESHPLDPPRTAKVQAFLQYILSTEYSPTKVCHSSLSMQDHATFHRTARYIAQITECFKVASLRSEEIEPLALFLRQCVRDPALGLGIPLAVLAGIFYNYHIATSGINGDEILNFTGTLRVLLRTQGLEGVARRIGLDREILVPALRLGRSETARLLARIDRVRKEYVVRGAALYPGSSPCGRSLLKNSVKGLFGRCRRQCGH